MIWCRRNPRRSSGQPKNNLSSNRPLKCPRFPSTERSKTRDGVWRLISFIHHCDILSGNFLELGCVLIRTRTSSSLFSLLAVIIIIRSALEPKKEWKAKSARREKVKAKVIKALKSLNFFLCGWKFSRFVLSRRNGNGKIIARKLGAKADGRGSRNGTGTCNNKTWTFCVFWGEEKLSLMNYLFLSLFDSLKRRAAKLIWKDFSCKKM